MSYLIQYISLYFQSISNNATAQLVQGSTVCEVTMQETWRTLYSETTLAVVQRYLQVINEPAHEIMALFVLHKLILQTRMRSHPVGLDVWFFIGPFLYFHTSCVRTAKALARLRRCAGTPESSLVAYVISTIISWAGLTVCRKYYVACGILVLTFYPDVSVRFCNSKKGFYDKLYKRTQKTTICNFGKCFAISVRLFNYCFH